MKNMPIYLMAILAFVAMTAVPQRCVAQSPTFDDFSDPASGSHASTPGESRAGFPPGTIAGTIFGLNSGTDIASDRGLFGSAGSLSVSNGLLNFSLPLGFSEIDWDVDGFDFNSEPMTWNSLTNRSGQDIDLRIELFQAFNGTGSVVGLGAVGFTIANGETRDVTFSTLAGATDFLGFRIVNDTNATFIGSLEGINAVPEPSGLLLLSVPTGFLLLRRKRGGRGTRR